MDKKPLLTICVTTHNGQNFIKQTLNSILEQNYSNFEILVSDNASTDRTLEIVSSLNSSKITIRHNNPPASDEDYIGCYDNYNGCIKSGLIKGEFVAFYHQDDIYQKDIANKEVDFLIQNPETGAVFTGRNIIDKNSKIIGSSKIPKILEGKNLYNFTEIFHTLMLYGNTFLPTPTFMIKKKVIEEVGLFNEKVFRTSADLEMWLRILQKHPIGILKDKLINYRVCGGGKKYHLLRTERADYFKVMEYYLENENLLFKCGGKFLRQYEYQKYFDDTFRVMNFLMRGEERAAKELINQKISFDVFRAFFENLNLKKIKGTLLRIVLFLGINLKVGNCLGKLLHKLR